MLIKLKMNGVREIHANSLEALREQVPLPLLTKLESMVDSIVVHEKNYFARNELSPQDWIEIQSNKYIADQNLACARAATGMRYTSIEDGLPPEQKNIVVMLKSGIPLLGRNIGGEFCQYDQINDRFVEWGSTDPWGGIESWFEVIPPLVHDPESMMLSGKIKSDPSNRQHLESLGVTIKHLNAGTPFSFDVELSKTALDEVLKFGADYEWHFERSVSVIDTHPPCQNFAGRTAEADPAP